MSAREGLDNFIKHTRTLDPAKNPQKINGFAREFQELKELTSRLKRDPKYSTSQGEREINRSKNRYKDILPYDHSRIKLPLVESVDGSDYINGNYIKGPDGKIMYLAAQGPLPRTVDDFWRLLWSHQIQVVVMVCREYEMGKLKCKRYWPDDTSEKVQFAGINISLVSKDDISDGFVMRTMSAKKGEQELIVTQFHYMAWPDHDVPHSAVPLIELIKSFRSFSQGSVKPVVIHCSAGCGRTGTICSVDYAWTLIKSEKTEKFNLFEIVAGMRRQRIAMVQTKEQYAYVYKSVIQLIDEQREKDQFSCHTYVNVEIARAVASQSLSHSPSPSSSPSESPLPSASPTQQERYENFDFINSINRWKGGQCSPRPTPKHEKPQPNGIKKPNVLSQKPRVNERQILDIPTKQSLQNDNSTAPVRQKPTTAGNNRSANPGTNYVNVSIGTNDKQLASQTSVTQGNYVDAGSKLSTANIPPVKMPQRPQRKSLPCGGNNEYEILPVNAGTGGERKLSHGNLLGSNNYAVPPPTKKEVPERLLIDFGPSEVVQIPQLPVRKPPLDSITGDAMPMKYENVILAPKPEASTKSSGSPSSSPPLSSSGLYAIPAAASLDTKKEVGKNYQTPSKTTYQAPVTPQKPGSDPRMGEAAVVDGLCKLNNPPTVPSPTHRKKSVPSLKTPVGSYCLVTPSTIQHNAVLPRTNTLPECPTREIPRVSGTRSLSKAATKPKVNPRPPLLIVNNSVVANSHVEHQTTAVAKPPLQKRPDSSPVDASPPTLPEVSSLDDLYASVDKTRKNLKRQSSDYGGGYSLVTVPVIERTSSDDHFGSRHMLPSSASLYSTAQDDNSKGRFKGFMRSSLKDAKESLKNWGQNRPSRDSEHQPADTKGVETTVDVGTDLYASVGPRLASKDIKNAGPTYETVSASLTPPPAHRVSSNSLKDDDHRDDEHQPPPTVPVKTSGAFLPREDNGTYDVVESQSQSKHGTLEKGFDKFRSRAMNLLSAVPDKVNLGMPTKRASDLSSSSITNTDVSSNGDLGYLKRVEKPKGARRQPRGWSNFSPLTML